MSFDCCCKANFMLLLLLRCLKQHNNKSTFDDPDWLFDNFTVQSVIKFQIITLSLIDIYIHKTRNAAFIHLRTFLFTHFNPVPVAALNSLCWWDGERGLDGTTGKHALGRKENGLVIDQLTRGISFSGGKGNRHDKFAWSVVPLNWKHPPSTTNNRYTSHALHLKRKFT